MKEVIFRLYSVAHITAKKLLGRCDLSSTKILSSIDGKYCACDDAVIRWHNFIQNSKITNGEFEGFHFAGYVLEKQKWCHASWIWTNAAIVRALISIGQIDQAKQLGEIIAKEQQSCGGWIVRNDYDANGPIPMLAPNDSAYIANNAFLKLYDATGDKKYLAIAKLCADWIVKTCREDGMVFTGYNTRDKKWDKRNIIVDVGFTGGLFAKIYQCTQDTIYLDFLKKFTLKYIDLFYDKNFKCFATSIDKNDSKQGGFFGRGQAWALEGLIPAYKVLNDSNIKGIIEETIKRIITLQNKDGSWSYNLSRKMMGNDCKGVSVIAKAISEWHMVTGNYHLISPINKALNWCKTHTLLEGEASGGIFSFCTEGAIVKDLYSSTAFVYASAYAIELEAFLSKISDNESDNSDSKKLRS